MWLTAYSIELRLRPNHTSTWTSQRVLTYISVFHKLPTYSIDWKRLIIFLRTYLVQFHFELIQGQVLGSDHTSLFVLTVNPFCFCSLSFTVSTDIWWRRKRKQKQLCCWFLSRNVGCRFSVRRSLDINVNPFQDSWNLPENINLVSGQLKSCQIDLKHLRQLMPYPTSYKSFKTPNSLPKASQRIQCDVHTSL